MSIRVATLSLLAAAVLCSSAAADWLVLRGGKRIETAGQWTVQGNLLTIRETTGRPKSVILSIVDFDATLRANPRSGQAPAAGWHITVEGIKRLQETSRQQESQAAQMRAQQESGRQADAVAGKPGLNGRSFGQTQGQAQPRAQPQSGSRGSGFDALAACKVWQDNPKLYSDCLAGH